MKKTFGLLIPVLTLLLSCSSDTINTSDFLAGESFTDSHLRVILVDTLTVETSTMKFDSIITSESSRILVGKYTDSIFGTIRASSYIGMLTSEFSIDDEAIYDSIALYLKLDKYYYNDTLQTNQIHVKQILNTLRPKEGDDFYNTAEATYSDDDIGFISYRPRPMEADTLEISISDELGNDIFTKLQERTITSADQFKDYFKGIALVPNEEDNGSVIGFSKDTGASYMRLYFSTEEETERVQSYIDIKFDLSSTPIPFYNQILAEDPIEPLQQLVNKERNLSSTDADQLSFIQSGIGMATRIQFPHIKSLYDIPGRGTILDAVLKIRPAAGTYNERLALRDTLSVYVVDRNNDLVEQLQYADVAAVTGNLNRENEQFNDIYYEISLGSYMEKLLLSEITTDEALILLPDDYNSTVDRFVLNGMDRSESSVVLELIYAIYDEDND